MIIDLHTHIFPDKIASKTIDALASMGSVTPYSDGTLLGLKSRLDRAKVDMAISLPVLTRPDQFDSVFAFSKKVNELYASEKRVLSFAGLHPLCNDLEGKVKLIKDSGFLGIKIHPDYQATYFDDDNYLRILRLAKENDLIVVTHAGVDVGYPDQPVRCTPDRVVKVLQRVGKMKLVLAHLGGCFMYDEVYNTLAGRDVYFDTSFVLQNVGKDKFNALVAKHGIDKILFGTDSPWTDIKEQVRLINEFVESSEQREMIFSKNLLSLLKEI